VGCIFLLWSVAVSLLGPYPEDSIQALRKGLLPQVLLFAGGLMFVRNVDDAWWALGLLLSSFAILTLLSLGEVSAYWGGNGMTMTVPRSHDHWWGSYGAMGACMMPLLVAWVTRPGRSRHAAVAALALAILVALLVFLYWARTPMVTMIISGLFVLLITRRWRALAGVVILICMFIAALALLPSQKLDRYTSLLKAETYVSNTGLSMRPALWQGMAEVIEKRPLQGYGYGWKKLALVVNEGGYAERWRKEGGDKATYFLGESSKAGYGRANPHSYFFQAAFEVGLIGLAMALLFWLLLLKATVPLLGKQHDSKVRAFAAALCGLWLAYWLSNITNGLWEGSLANITIALSASLLACRREHD
jgi:O-antigen ligase